MKRFLVLMAFTLTTGWASAQSNGFKFDIGLEPGFLGLSNDLETNQGGVLTDDRATFSFWGGSAFADISDYFTVSAGVWSGLGKANLRSDADPSHIKGTATNGLLLAEIAGVLKAPISLRDHFVFSPKIGLSQMLYLAGDFGGGAPNSEVKHLVSPLSVLLGADTDYNLPGGLLIRVPLDVSYALNSRPASVSGKYVASSTLAFRAGISFGYRLF